MKLSFLLGALTLDSYCLVQSAAFVAQPAYFTGPQRLLPNLEENVHSASEEKEYSNYGLATNGDLGLWGEFGCYRQAQRPKFSLIYAQRQNIAIK